MVVPVDSIHKTRVSSWAGPNAEALSAEQLIRLFGAAIRAVEQRSLATLSNVTLMVVVDRALRECVEKFPVLSEIKAQPQGMDLGALLGKSAGLEIKELREALEHLLVVLLTVLGNITADILTAPLHKALMEVTRESALNAPEAQTLQALHLVKAGKAKREES